MSWPRSTATPSTPASTSGRPRATPEGATLPAGELERWTRALLEAAGLEPEPAATVAQTLVWTSLRGTDSHGVARVPVYVDRLRGGTINTRPRPSVLRRDGAIAIVDGDRGPGQVASVFATDLSVELAREHGAGVACVRRSSHNGAQAFYAMRAAEQGMVAIALTNTEPLVIPYGGAEPALGTNPICLAAPSAGGVFNLDLATSQVAVNRIFNARDEGRPIPADWGVDADGRPTTDPAAVVSAVPLGGYKGYALALMVEVLCGVLAGAGVRHGVGGLYTGADIEQDVGHFHLAIDPERTVGRERFAAVLDGLLGELRAIPPAPGFDEVLVPGDPEDRARAVRESSGVPIGPALWRTLRELSAELGVPSPS
jgi:ureidoglycolate dehydrogenase (NAD+)